MGSFLDELLLLIDALHLLFVLLLHIFSVKFDNFRLQILIILSETIITLMKF